DTVLGKAWIQQVLKKKGKIARIAPKNTHLMLLDWLSCSPESIKSDLLERAGGESHLLRRTADAMDFIERESLVLSLDRERGS
ncbi:hypothetical protein BGX27_005006, partial [Mortierella sp. AM989]